MRIALTDYSGHAFTAQLARALAERGHDVVHLHFAEFQTPKGRLARILGDPSHLTFEAISLGEPFAKHNLLRRRFQEAEVGRRLAVRLREFRPDVTLAGNLPLDALRHVQAGTRDVRARFVFWQQDIYSEAISRILKQKLSFVGGAIGFWYRTLEKQLLSMSDAIVVIADDFADHVRNVMHVNQVPIHVIENWAPLADIPTRPKQNAWAKAHSLHDKRVILYTGTLGMKHDPSRLLALAQALAPRNDCAVVIASEGPAVDWLQSKKAELNLASLIIVGFQPVDAYPDVLATGDVLVSILEDDAGVFSVPSKVLSYLCAGRPIVFHGPDNNLAAKTVVRTGSGLVFAGSRRDDFVSQTIQLLDDSERRARMGTNGRAYAVKTFDIANIASRFETVFNAESKLAQYQ